MTRALVRLAIGSAVLAVFVLYSAGVLRSGLLDRIETFTYDARVRLSADGVRDPRIVIVDLDERSLLEQGQWPWPRDTLAQLVDRLFDDYAVRALGFDMYFPEADAQSPQRLLRKLAETGLDTTAGFAELNAALGERDHDRRFAQALDQRPVVLGYVFKQGVAEGDLRRQGELGPSLFAGEDTLHFLRPEGYTGNLPVLQQAAAGGGFFDAPLVDEDGVYRRVPLVQWYEGRVYPSLALALTRLALGEAEVTFEFDPPEARGPLNLDAVRVGPLRVPVDERFAAWVPYRGGAGTFRYVSATDVLGGVAEKAALRGAIVLLGTTAPGLKDQRVTPVERVFPGVEIHANLISGMLDGRVRQRAPYYMGIQVVELALITLLVSLLFARLSPLLGAGLALGTEVLLVALALWAWRQDQIVPMGVPMVFTLFLFLAQQLHGYFVESRGKREISRLFGQYVPPQLVEEMASRPQAVSMEGDIREMSVLFSDVRGFTSISEQLDAKSLSDMMNQFLTPQTRCIHQQRGTIDKYMGDAIMAFWGAPLPDEAHALHAVNAARDMVNAVSALNPQFEARGWPRIRVGVGISTGSMRVGNMGSEFRVAYTVMGDPVNLASRLEGLTRVYGVDIIVSEATRSQMPSDWAMRELDRVRVKGKVEPVQIYEPLGPKGELDADTREALARHRGALRAYRARRWDEAETAWFNLDRQAGGDTLYRIYLDRIAHLRREPPAEGWDGVFTFDRK